MRDYLVERFIHLLDRVLRWVEYDHASNELRTGTETDAGKLNGNAPDRCEWH